MRRQGRLGCATEGPRGRWSGAEEAGGVLCSAHGPPTHHPVKGSVVTLLEWCTPTVRSSASELRREYRSRRSPRKASRSQVADEPLNPASDKITRNCSGRFFRRSSKSFCGFLFSASNIENPRASTRTCSAAMRPRAYEHGLTARVRGRGRRVDGAEGRFS